MFRAKNGSRTHQRRTALVTGASRGIGEAIARRLARDGWDLVLVARSTQQLEVCRRTLLGLGAARVELLASDLALPGAAEKVCAAVEAAGLQIDMLVNNAGQGTYGDFVHQDSRSVARLIRLNIEAPTALARLLLPAMVERGQGTLIQIASTAGLRPGPQLAVYSAAKAYLTSLTQSLASELDGTGVRVLAVCPGPTRTGFRAAAGLSDDGPPNAASVASVADFAIDAVTRRGVVFVHGRRNQLASILTPLLPRSLLAWLVNRRRTRQIRSARPR